MINLGQFFTGDYPGPAFEFLGPAHLAALGFLVALNLFLIVRYRNTDEKTRGALRWTLALILWGNEFAWHYWN